MARVDLQRISKRYPGVAGARRHRLSVQSGEFFTLLGPSGCGKTTLLRTIAGFNQQDSGEVLVDGRRIDDVPAHRRNIGMVFQDYAIFPHMSVGDNVAFGLVTRRVPAARDRASASARALELVQLGGLAARLPHELSGGQQQRVALARAVVINPQILLMDEPLSNLDAKLRDRVAGRHPRPAALARHHDDLRDARPGGGARDLRPHLHHARRSRPPDRDAAGDLRAAGDAVRRVVRRRDERIPDSPWALAARLRSERRRARCRRSAARSKVTLAVRPEDIELSTTQTPSDARFPSTAPSTR